MSNRHLKSAFLKCNSWSLSFSTLFLLPFQAQLTSNLPSSYSGQKTWNHLLLFPFLTSTYSLLGNPIDFFLQNIFIIWSLLILVTSWSKSPVSIIRMTIMISLIGLSAAILAASIFFFKFLIKPTAKLIPWKHVRPSHFSAQNPCLGLTCHSK